MPTRATFLRLVALGLFVSSSITSANAQQPGVAAAPPQIRTVLQPLNADQLRTSQVLGMPTSHCGHVIDLLMHNQMRRQAGHSLAGAPQVQLPHLSVGMAPGDLELLCVHLVSEGDTCRGPIFQISMRNNSQIPIGNFRISLVGFVGQIHIHAPTAIVAVGRMEAGEETQIRIQLPMTCMALGSVGQTVPFDTLVVAIDSFDELLECNELNNVQILARAEIPMLVTATVPVVSGTTPGAAGPAQSAPAEAVPQPGPGSAPEKTEPSPLDNIDLDRLGLDDAQGTAVRIR